MTSHADFLGIEWDETGLHLLFDLDELPFETALNLRVNDPVEFYRAVRQSCDSWIAEMDEARREHQTGVARDPSMQEALDRIRQAEDNYSKRWDRLAEAGDHARKAWKENR